MNEPTAFQRALHEQYFGKQVEGGGVPFTLEDILHQVQQCRNLGMSVEQHAESLGVPVAYLQQLYGSEGGA